MTTEPTALLRRAEAYLSALHGSVALHDNLAANLACAGCELRDEIRAALAADPPPPADRAAVLREAADAVFALDYDAMVGEEGDENLGSMREAWDLGTVHATLLLRRLADEAQQPDPHSCPNCEGIDPDTCLMNPNRPPEQCPRSEGDGYGLQCQKPAGHNLCTFEEEQPPSGPCVAGEQQNETPEAATVHAVPLPGSNGISSCCGRPPCEFVGERVTRDPAKVTCTGPTAGVRQDGAQP